MSPSKKTFVVGTICTVVPVLLLLIDKQLLDCVEQTKMFPYVLGQVHEMIQVSVLLIPVGIFFLLGSLVLKRRSQDRSFSYIAYEIVLLLILLLLLASVVLASMNTARSKSPNGEVKATATNFRAEAEVYFDAHSQTYTGLCSSQKFLDAQMRLRESMPKQGLLCRIPQYDLICNDGVDSYAVSVKLPSQYDKDVKYFCIDSTEFSKETEQILVGTLCK